MSSFFSRLEEKRLSTVETETQQAERQRVLDDLAKYGKVAVIYFVNKGLQAAVVRLRLERRVRFVDTPADYQGGCVEVVS